MRKAAMAAVLFGALAIGTPRLTGQEKTAQEKSSLEKSAATETSSAQPQSLKIAVTFSEFEGDKKVKSLPYTTIVIADGKNPKSVLKTGSRVPVYAGKDYSMQYLDIGTSIDCLASRTNDNRFDIRLGLERSWLEGAVPVPMDSGTSQSNREFQEPIVQQFKSELSLTLRDGQTVESSFATDPLSGRVFRAEVSLNVMK